MVAPLDTLEKQEGTKFKRSILKQFLLGVMMNFSSIAPSMSLGFSAVALPVLTDTTYPNYLTEDQGSWFASIASLATPIGCFLSGPLSDKYGRRGAVYCVNVVGFVGWIVISSAYYVSASQGQYPMLLVGRVLTGLSTGLASMPASVYMAEIASRKLVGVFTAWSSISFSLGVFIVYVLGFFLKQYWGTMALITAAFPCLGMIFTVFWVPESPSWLVGKNRYDQATVNMCKIWGTRDVVPEIRTEIDTLIKNKSKHASVSDGVTVQKTFLVKCQNKLKYFKRPTCWKPFILLVLLFFFQQFSGVYSIVFYAIDICKEAGIQMDSYVAITLIGLVRLLTAIFTSFLNRRMGKKPLSIISGLGITVSMLGLAVFITLKNRGSIDSTQFTALPPLLLFSYFILSTVGFLIVPFAMSAEVYPLKIRGLASALTVCCGYGFNFIVVKTYVTTVNEIGIDGVFYLYGAVALAGTLFAVFVLPETRNKTIHEIEEYFGGQRQSLENRNISLLGEKV